VHIHHRAYRTFGEGAEAQIAHAADICSGDFGLSRDTGGIGGNGEQHSLLVDIECTGILGPALPDMLADGAALIRAERRRVIAQGIPPTIRLPPAGWI
jgi:hypothetical protein